MYLFVDGLHSWAMLNSIFFLCFFFLRVQVLPYLYVPISDLGPISNAEGIY